MSSGGGSGLRGRRFGGGMGTLSEMNVVPLVDVVLVLLIIFMLTAQAMEFGLDIKAPETKYAPEKGPQDLPVISLSRTGKLYLGDKPVNNINSIGDEIRRRYKNQNAVYVKSDGQVVVEQLMQVIAELSHSHFDVKVVTKTAEDKR